MSISTSQAKFGSSSIRHLGGSSSYINTPSSNFFDFGSKIPFTVELFYQPGTYDGNDHGIFASDIASTYAQFRIYQSNFSGQRRIYWLIGNDSLTSWAANGSGGNVLSDGVWAHIALTGDGTNLRLYVNGVNVLSVAHPNWGSANGQFFIGDVPGAIGLGYYDEVRVVKGTAIYYGTSSFTPPTAPFPGVEVATEDLFIDDVFLDSIFLFKENK
jgi:hypothetical protein